MSHSTSLVLTINIANCEHKMAARLWGLPQPHQQLLRILTSFMGWWTPNDMTLTFLREHRWMGHLISILTRSMAGLVLSDLCPVCLIHIHPHTHVGFKLVVVSSLSIQRRIGLLAHMSTKFEYGSCRVKNLVTRSNQKKILVINTTGHICDRIFYETWSECLLWQCLGLVRTWVMKSKQTRSNLRQVLCILVQLRPSNLDNLYNLVYGIELWYFITLNMTLLPTFTFFCL